MTDDKGELTPTPGLPATPATRRRKPPRVKVLSVGEVNGQRTARLAPAGETHADAVAWTEHLAESLGTISADFADSALFTLSQMSVPEGGKGNPSEAALNGLLAAVDGAGPRDEIEAMLAVQMATTHALAMACIRRAHVADSLQRLEVNGNMATKMLRTYVAQVEALAKLRRGGEQTVRVEHVHVYEGGQAIVGHVEHRGGGDGRSDRQTHGAPDARALAVAPSAPVWSKEPSRKPVPAGSSQGQEAMQAPRRRRGNRSA